MPFFRRTSSNAYLLLRGLDRRRKRECLTAVHNFLRTRPDGTTAAERFFGQKPRSMFAAILGSVDIPPAPLVRRDEQWLRLKDAGWPTP